MTPCKPPLVPLRIRLPYATEDEFVKCYGENVSGDGIFIATHALSAEGTGVSFEFVLNDGSRLMRGEGEVQTTDSGEEAGRPGMRVRFTRLDAPTKALIDRLLATRSQTDPITPSVGPQVPPNPITPSVGPQAQSRGAALASEDLVLGIDLGTTHTRAAIVQNGVAQLIRLGEADTPWSMPSVIAFDESGRCLLGAPAKARRVSDAPNTVVGAARLLGRRVRPALLHHGAERFALPILRDSQGDAGVELCETMFSLPELAAMLFTHLKKTVQDRLGRPLTRAVLCVPPSFTDLQRAAMLIAAEMAGLEVLRLVNEPSAIALAFAQGRGLARKRVLLYDLGGATFDLSVIELTGDDIEVVTTGGDDSLGGIDFDLRLAQHLCLTHGSPISGRILDAAEQAKIALSTSETCPVRVTGACLDLNGAPADLEASLTRVSLEQATAGLVERTLAVTRAVLDARGLKPESLDEVLLCGGQSKAPLVRRRVEEALGKKARTDLDPEGAAALGAAILGQALLASEQGRPGPCVSEVLSLPIGIGLRGGAMHRVLEKNTRLPAEKTIALPVTAGLPMGLAIFQGTSAVAEENEYLGSLRALADGTGELSVSFMVGPDGRLQLSASGPFGRKAEYTVTTDDSPEEARAALLAEAPLPKREPSPSGGFLGGLKKLFGRS